MCSWLAGAQLNNPSFWFLASATCVQLLAAGLLSLSSGIDLLGGDVAVLNTLILATASVGLAFAPV